jgi:hypothetical protein
VPLEEAQTLIETLRNPKAPHELLRDLSLQ